MIQEALPGAQIAFDHMAFRTFGVEHLGITSLSRWFLDMGYAQQPEVLRFPAKKLRARWLAPPPSELPLPRIFISELIVDELSPSAQQIIRRYTTPNAEIMGRYGPATGLLGQEPWEPPSVEDFEALAEESEYASWVLVNGYLLNHTTVAVHRLEELHGGISALNALLKGAGLELNAEGGEVKVSPDGLLLQSSTIADCRPFTFAGGEMLSVPAGYIEFAERRVLPQFEGLPADEIQERHRRDGFEVGNADRIFESTTLAARQASEAQ